MALIQKRILLLSHPQAKYKDKGSEIAEDQLNQMSRQLEVFRTNLEEFAANHKTEIRKNPEFRMQFQDMCATIGVDPLACKCHSKWAPRLIWGCIQETTWLKIQVTFIYSRLLPWFLSINSSKLLKFCTMIPCTKIAH